MKLLNSNDKTLNSNYFDNRDDNHSKTAKLINGNLTLFRDSKTFGKEIHIFLIKNQDFSNTFQIHEPTIHCTKNEVFH